jgi:tRNA 2-selenouridine synthase
VTLQEYVNDALAEYTQIYGEDEGRARWADSLRDSLRRIRKRLGGSNYQRISQLLEDALKQHGQSGSTEGHRVWIDALLHDYYDSMYNYQLQQKQERIRFSGDRDEVESYLTDKYRIEVVG